MATPRLTWRYVMRDVEGAAKRRSGVIVGAACSGYLTDRISRKWTKFYSGCVFVIGAVLQATAQNSAWLIGARFVLGLAVGTASFVARE